MAILVFGNLIVFLVVCCIVIYRGLDLKKRSSWWYGLYAFISGFMIGFLRSDDNGGYHVVTNLIASLQAGAVFLLILIGSVITHQQKSWAEKYLARSEEESQEKLESLAESLFNDKSKGK